MRNIHRWILIPIAFNFVLLTVTGLINLIGETTGQVFLNSDFTMLLASGVGTYLAILACFHIAPVKTQRSLYGIGSFALLIFLVSLIYSLRNQVYSDMWGYVGNLAGLVASVYYLKDEYKDKMGINDISWPSKKVNENDIMVLWERTTPKLYHDAKRLVEKQEISSFLAYWHENLFMVDVKYKEWRDGFTFIEEDYPELGDKDVIFCFKIITILIETGKLNTEPIPRRLQDLSQRILGRLIELKQIGDSQKYRFKVAPKECPVCGSNSIASILYGYPKFDAIQDELDSGKIVLGGCAISFDGSDPSWQCIVCKSNFYLDVNRED